MTKIPEIRINVMRALLDLTKRTDPIMNYYFSDNSVYKRGRKGNFIGDKLLPIWSRKNEPRNRVQTASELHWLFTMGYAEANIIDDADERIIGYRIKPEKISEVEKMLAEAQGDK